MFPYRMSILFFIFVLDLEERASAFHRAKKMPLSFPDICLNLGFQFIDIVELFFWSQIMIKLQDDRLPTCFLFLIIAEEMDRKDGVLPI